nr:hypothetical protein [Tanacetum cinerariifolium]
MKFLNRLDVPTRQILGSKGVIPTKTFADAKIAIQEMAEYSQKWQNGTSSKARSTKTFDGLAAIQAQLNSLGREIKKVNEKVYAAQFGTPYQPVGQYRVAGPGFYQRNNGNSSYPDQRQTLEELLTKFMVESAKRHEENSNIIKEIRASTNAAIRNQGASIKTLEIQIGQMSKVLQERGIGCMPGLTEPNPRLDVPTRQILGSKGVIPTKTFADAKIAIQEMAEYSQKWQNGTSSKARSTKTFDGLAAIQAQLNSLGREIKKVNEKVYAAQVGYELCKGPHYTKDCPIKEEENTLEEAYYT